MSPRGRRILWGLLLGGLGVRVVLAFATLGISYDLESLRLVVVRLHEPDPFGLYADVNRSALRWPYPTGYLPWLLVSAGVANRTNLPFDGVVQLLPIVCDAALAWVVQAFLGHRGATERTRLVAAGLVALGPSFALVSGYEGQIDSAAIMPAAAALLGWERLSAGRRGLIAGALIGVGASIKTVPLVVVLALLPQASSRREAAGLVGAAIAVPLVLLAPWLAAEPAATSAALRYSGVPGYGGLSLLAQPSLAEVHLLNGRPGQATDLTVTLLQLGPPITLGALAAVFALLVWRRPDPATGALLVWLSIFSFGLNFGPRYVVWGVPFMLMAGYLRAAAVVQAIAFPAAVIILARRFDAPWPATVYTVLMLALLALFLAWLVLLAWRLRPAATSGA